MTGKRWPQPCAPPLGVRSRSSERFQWNRHHKPRPGTPKGRCSARYWPRRGSARPGGVRAFVRGRASRSEAAPGGCRCGRLLAASGRGWSCVFAEAHTVFRRVGARSCDRRSEDRRSVRGQRDGLDADHRAGRGSANGLCSGRCIHRGGGRAGAEDRDCPVASAARGRRWWERVVPRGDGTDRRRVSLFDHRHGVRRAHDVSAAARLARGLAPFSERFSPTCSPAPCSERFRRRSLFVLWGLFVLIMMAAAFCDCRAPVGARGRRHAHRRRSFRDLWRARRGWRGSVALPACILANLRAVAAGRRRHDRGAKHDLLRWERDRAVAPRTRRLPRSGRSGRDRGPPTKTARGHGGGGGGNSIRRRWRCRRVNSLSIGMQKVRMRRSMALNRHEIEMSPLEV